MLVPSAGAQGAGPAARRRPTTVTLRLGERDATLRGRRRPAHHPAHRGRVPELPRPHPARPTPTGSPSAARRCSRRVRRVRCSPARPPRCAWRMSRRRPRARRPSPRTSARPTRSSTPSTRATELTVAFNPEYLLAGIEVTAGDEVTLETIDALKPALLRAAEHPGVPVPADARPGLLEPASEARAAPAPLADRLPVATPSAELALRAGPHRAARRQRRRARPTCSRPSAYLATLSSFRGAPTEALVRHGRRPAVVRAEGEREGREPADRGRARAPAAATGCRSTGSACTRARDLLGALRVTVFSPDDLDAGQGRPGRAPPLPRRHAGGARTPATTRCAPSSTRCCASATPC